MNDLIKKAVIPAAGLGTRLLPATKEQPKEMLPILVRGADGKNYIKPFLQVVFEQLFEAGIKEFCFIVGGKIEHPPFYFKLKSSDATFRNPLAVLPG